jgi:hypothetical protein
MVSPRTLLIGLAMTALAGAANAEPIGACVWGKLSAAEHAKVLAAYQQNMAGGAAALDRLGGKLKTATAACAKRSDVPADWVPTIAGSEAVQIYAATALKTDRAKLDAAWAAAPANVAACIRANGRLAFYPNGTGCTDPAASAWLLKRIGVAPNQPPASQQAIYYFNARAIGDWADQLVAKLPPKGKR